MALFKSPIFILCCALFIVHQAVIIIFDNSFLFIDAYLDCFLAMPIILTFLLWERTFLFKWKNYYRLTITEVIIATLFVALISEIVFPALSDDFTGDWLDLIFYLLGALLFYFTINPGIKEVK